MSPTPPSAVVAKRQALLINRNFALLWVGQGISVVGDQVFRTTLVVWIGAVLTAHLSTSALALSGVLVAAALPTLLFAPIAGVFVDRWDRRRTLMVMDGMRTVLIAALLPATGAVALPFATATDLPVAVRLGAIYTVVLLASLCAQFFNPARFALIGDIVEEPALARASGLTQASQSLAAVIGPPLAAPLLFVFGIQWALLIDACSFAVSFLTILAIRMPQTPTSIHSSKQGHIRQEMRDGVAFTIGNRSLMAIIVSAMLVVLGAGALSTLLIYFVTGYLHTPATFYGFIDAAEGVGALAGAVVASQIAERLGVARVYSWSIVAAGLLLFALAQTTHFIPALVITAVIGIFTAAMNVALTPLVLKLVPRELLGRVFSLIQPCFVLSGLVGTAAAGYLDSVVLAGVHANILGVVVRPVTAVYTGAAVAVVLGGIYALSTLRRISTGDIKSM